MICNLEKRILPHLPTRHRVLIDANQMISTVNVIIRASDAFQGVNQEGWFIHEFGVMATNVAKRSLLLGQWRPSVSRC